MKSTARYGGPSSSSASTLRGMISIVIAILLAALVYWLCIALGLPAIVALIAAVLVLLAGVPVGGRWRR